MIADMPAARARWRNTLMVRASDDVQLGIEYNPLGDAQQLGPLVNWRVVREKGDLPAVIVGTSSDRIGTPSGQAVYVTVSRTVAKGINVWTGVSWSGYQRAFLIPAGARWQIDGHLSTMFVYDGVNGHPMVTYEWDRFSATFLMVGGRKPGLSFSVGF